MKILLDECVRWPLSKILAAHLCMSVQSCGWSGFSNGELLGKAENDFDLFVTADQNIPYQQSLKNRKIAVLQLSTNKWRLIQASSDRILKAIASVKPGEYVEIAIP